MTTGMSRRTWLKRSAAAIAAGAAGIGLYSRSFEPHWVEVVRRTLPIEGLPASLEGKTLVQISDIHIGDRVSETFLIDWFQRVTQWQPEFVVMTGDVVSTREDNSLPLNAMRRVLKHFPQGTLGTLGVLGNHDYGKFWTDNHVANVVAGMATDVGIQLLRNARCEIAGLQIVGFDDLWSPNFGHQKVIAETDITRPTITLCHNPDAADLPIWGGYRGWILSGHTHGGQCKAPFLRPPLLPVKNRNYAAGEIALADGRHLYVNRALGHSLQIRFNVRPEITVFQLNREHTDQPAQNSTPG